jgi:hypothetical protein
MSFFDDLDEAVRGTASARGTGNGTGNGFDPTGTGLGNRPALDDLKFLTLEHWLTREIPDPDFLLGEVFSTTSRTFIIGPTGLGKTNFGLAFSWQIAAGRGFLHWQGPVRPNKGDEHTIWRNADHDLPVTRIGEPELGPDGRMYQKVQYRDEPPSHVPADELHTIGGPGGRAGPPKVLYIDGEMSRRSMRKRLRDAERRAGCRPPGLFVLNHEDFSDLAPLNSEKGQQFIDAIIELLGGIDMVIFDNVQSLTNGKLIEEESWQEILPWVLDLTRREIGQVWIHHTGYDQTHGYGTSTREWRQDNVILLEKLDELPEGAAFAFGLKFLKARERDHDNAADFADAVFTLTNDEWTIMQGNDQPARSNDTKQQNGKRNASAKKTTERGKLEDTALEALTNAIIEEGEEPAGKLIPPHTRCVPQKTWGSYFARVYVADGGEESTDRRFRELANKLRAQHRVGIDKPWVWVVRDAGNGG